MRLYFIGMFFGHRCDIMKTNDGGERMQRILTGLDFVSNRNHILREISACADAGMETSPFNTSAIP